MPYSLKGGIGLFTIKAVYNVDYWLTVGSLTLVLWSSIPPHTYRVILSPFVGNTLLSWGSQIGFFNPVIMTQVFPRSRNPGYFWHPVSLALTFHPRIPSSYCFEIPPACKWENGSRRTHWGLQLLLQFCLQENKNKLPLPEDCENSTGGGRMSPKWGKGCICLSLRGLTRSDCGLAYSGDS